MCIRLNSKELCEDDPSADGNATDRFADALAHDQALYETAHVVAHRQSNSSTQPCAEL